MSFQYINPSEEEKELMQTFRDKFEELQILIDRKVQHSRWRSVCFTKLEEASFWLNKSITKNDLI